MSELRNLLVKYREWLKEMKGNKRSLDLFNLNAGDKPFDVVTGVKPAKIMSMYSNYDLIIDRLNSSVKKCKSKEQKNKFLEMFYIGTRTLVKDKFKM